MIQGVLFDMDGVLLNTERLGRSIYLQACAETGYPRMDEQRYERLLGRPREEDCRLMLEMMGPDFPFDRVYDLYRARLVALVLSDVDATKPGLHACMQGLKQRGMRIALATSTARDVVEQYIAHIPAMQQVFDAVVCGTEAGRGKPAPDIYLEAARRLGLPPQQCAGVEDSIAGLQSLSAAGCVRVMIPDLLPCDRRVAGLVDHQLQSLDQLPALIDRLNLSARVK